MFAVFYELGLCASLGGEEKQGGEGGRASLCHHGREAMGEEISFSDWKTEQTVTVKVTLRNFTAQDQTSAVTNF